MDTKTNQTEPAEPQVNGAFLRLLQNHRAGQALTDVSEALAKLTEAVVLSGRPGAVSVKFTLKPASKGGAVAIVVEDDLTLRLPKMEKANSIFFADPQSWQLLRDNPHQMKLQLKEVAGEAEAAAEPLRKAL